MPYLLTEYNNYLASIGQPSVDSINQDLEWLWWTHSLTSCGSGSSSGIIIRVNGSCYDPSALQPISASENPLVEFDCTQSLYNTGYFQFYLRATNPQSGCSKLALVCFNVDTCTVSCTSSVNISVSGCNLLSAVSNCPSPSYEWRDPDNILVSSSQSITATKTGIYTVRVYNCPNCTNPVTDSVYVDCGPVVNCDCTAQIFLNSSSCELVANICSGWSITWQYSLSPSSGYINTGATGSAYSPTINNRYYRAIYSKSGCTSKISNSIFVSCVSEPCTISIDSISIDGSNLIQVTWSGANGSITPVWYKYNEVSGTCNVSNTSKFVVTAGASFSSSPTSGFATLNPQNGDGCYEILLNDGTCQVSNKIYWTNNCLLPCDGNFTTRALFFDHSSAISSATIGDMQITSLRINRGSGFVEEVPSPISLSYSSNIVVSSNSYNPSLINSINALGILYFTANTPEVADLLPNGQDLSRYFRIKYPSCWSWDLRLRWTSGNEVYYTRAHAQNLTNSSAGWRLEYTGVTINGTRYNPLAPIEYYNDSVGEVSGAADLIIAEIISAVSAENRDYHKLQLAIYQSGSGSIYLYINFINYSNTGETNGFHNRYYLSSGASPVDNDFYFTTNPFEPVAPWDVEDLGSLPSNVIVRDYKFLSNGFTTLTTSGFINQPESELIIWNQNNNGTGYYVGVEPTPWNFNTSSQNNSFVTNEC